ncbi:hypothetical protein HFD88_005731 [Aspergillus terreus]|nr:hypothetical protein HFD88_005731 [Aspergillus terreus]
MDHLQGKSGYDVLEGRSSTEDIELRRIQDKTFHRKAIICNLLLFAISIFCILLSVFNSQRVICECNPLEETTYYSTVLEDLHSHWGPKQFRTGQLYDRASLLRQPPSPEVDEEWDRLTDVGVMHVSRDDILELGKDPSITVQAPEDWGYGPDRHLVHLDGVHLLHCLNAMRKSLHFNFEYYFPDGISRVYHAHLSHCLESLAQRLMCQPSIELISYNWVEKQVAPFPDFDIYHQCWDYEALLAWQDRHRVTQIQHKWPRLQRPEETPQLPVPLLMLEAYNVTREEADFVVP